MRTRTESEYPTGTEGAASYFTSRILYDDLAIVIRRFPPVEGEPTEGRPFVLVHGCHNRRPRGRAGSPPRGGGHRGSGSRRPLDGNAGGHAVGSRSPDATDRIVLLAPTMDPDARGFWKATGRLMRDILTREPPEVNAIVSVDYFFRCGVPYFLKQTKHLLADRIEDRLPQLEVKGLVIRADKDCICTPGWTRRVAGLLKDGSYGEVPGPHVIMFTDPPKVAAYIANHAWA